MYHWSFGLLEDLENIFVERNNEICLLNMYEIVLLHTHILILLTAFNSTTERYDTDTRHSTR